jgi:hypothetical protein
MILEMETTQSELANRQPQQPPDAAFLQLLFGKHIAYSLSAVARLGVADHINGAPEAIETLAAKTNAKPELLYRVMRLLGTVGVFDELPGKRFALTPVGELMKTSSRGSLRHMAIMFGDPWSASAYAHITDCLCTGRDGVTLEYGKHAFDLFADHPDWAENFHRAMIDYSSTTAAAVLKSYDFGGIRRLADIGGGHGMVLAAILAQYPDMQGVLYDLPNVVTGAPATSHFEKCKDRIRIEAGSFFERVPAGCDAYILKHIIHDWDDEHGRQILRLIREELPEDGRVLLCEMVVPDEPGPAPAKMLDIEMLVLTPGGKERTEAEFHELFESAGLRLSQIVRTETAMCVLEGRLN